MTPAGWYDDPLIPGGKRYWDGNQWTDHAQPPPASPAAAGQGVGGPVPGAPVPGAPMPGAPTPGAPVPAAPMPGVPMESPPPFSATPGVFPPVPGPMPVYTGSGINDLGTWISRSFSMVFQRFSSLSAFFVPQLIFWAVGYLLLDRSLRGAVITNDGDFLGFDSAMIYASLMVYALSIVVGLITLLAGHHSLYAGHIGQQPSIAESFSAALRNLFRYIGVLILLYLAMLVVFGLLFGLAIALSVLAGDSADALLGIGIVLGYLVFFALSIWLSVKLAFVTVGAAVMPKGTSVIKTSWNITDGHFWGIFGRQLLLGLLVGMLGMVVYFITYIAIIALVFTQFGFTADGRLTIDGQDIETLSIFEFADFLPNPILVVAVIAILGFLVYIIQAIVYSGTAALYADLRGPNVFGHGGREAVSDW